MAFNIILALDLGKMTIKISEYAHKRGTLYVCDLRMQVTACTRVECDFGACPVGMFIAW